MLRLRYSFWDGSQEPFALEPDDLMDEIADELFNHGSVRRALQRLMQRGMTGRNGQRREGVRDLIERVKQRRQEQLERHDLGSILEGIRERLEEIVDTERSGIGRRLDEARGKAAEDADQGGLLETLQNLADRRRDTLDQLPPDPAGQVKALSDYDFMDQDARQKFQDLMDELKQQAMEQYFKDMQQSLQGMSPEQMQGMKQALRDLNELLQRHDRGQVSDEEFQQFMQRNGSMFGPQKPADMDELIDQLQERMAQAKSLLDSMPEETRRQMQELINSVMDDEMRQEMGELASTLDALYPPDELRRRYPFTGQDEISLEEAMRLMDHLQELDKLEDQLQGVRGPENLDDVDEAKVAELLGEEARQSWEELKEMTRKLEEAGYIRRNGDKLELTPQGIRKIGQKAIRDIFDRLKKDRIGAHELHHRGAGGEPSGDTKPWELGDDFAVDLQRSLMNTVQRTGAGTPLRMHPDDFEVHRVEHTTQTATCLLLDRSRSMGYYGNFIAAKKVAIALQALIRSKYSRDSLYIIGFSDIAIEFKDEDLPELSWDTGISGTNMHHAFMLSRKLLSKHKGSTRQIIMITDGEPTAHLEHGLPYFSYPPSPRTISETLQEARRCTQEGITINTFMLENSYPLVDFINLMTRVNRGRAFYASPDQLGEYVLVDYLANRRRHVA
jgi:uncharacterized protein with von Willebrand factor type A (vWA) domain